MVFPLEQSELNIVAEIVEILRSGGSVLFPSGEPWNWAIAIDATNTNAVEHLLQIKKVLRPEKWYIFVIDEIMHRDFICDIPDSVRKYIRSQDDDVAVIFTCSAPKIARKLKTKNWEFVSTLIPQMNTREIKMSQHIVRLLGKPVYVTPAVLSDDSRESPDQLPKHRENIASEIYTGVSYISPLVFSASSKWNVGHLIRHNSDGTIKVIYVQ